MPKVTWCKPKVSVEQEFVKRLDAARQYAEVGVDRLLHESHMTRGTYYRRREDPNTMTVGELRGLVKSVNLCSTQEGRDALLRLVGAI